MKKKTHDFFYDLFYTGVTILYIAEPIYKKGDIVQIGQSHNYFVIKSVIGKSFFSWIIAKLCGIDLSNNVYIVKPIKCK